ncbi:hypothetical protein HO173_000152 [Letharia columbiana]|uniref:Uncharacterized protein n=1 Tax=Letharia columbiana TaxID=112416 RepID=A0A8H6G6H5_9LECA|nr:uncharacterized protein HO173_000152 [Letharia columbiana]KAF6241442.1 hypothetical protein HO173_000152 [Letharia columbiana]
MDSAVDEEENREDKNEQHDWKDIEEDEDDIQNCGEEREVSALAIIVPSQMVREIPKTTIDKETGRIFNHMPFAEKLRILCGSGFCGHDMDFCDWLRPVGNGSGVREYYSDGGLRNMSRGEQA